MVKKVITVSSFVDDINMLPIIQGVIVRNDLFFSFYKKVSRELIQDLHTGIFLNIEDIITDDDLIDNPKEDYIISLYNKRNDLHDTDNSIKEYLEGWYRQKNRSEKIDSLGL
jgi:hypothetical protein